MILGRLGQEAIEDFTTTDSNNNLIAGLDGTTFTAHLFDPNDNEVSGSIPCEIKELGNGHYRASYIPNTVGMWYIVVYHSSYFPWGKSDSVQVFSNDFDSIGDMLMRSLGLMQENFYMDQNVYSATNLLTSSRIRIYNDSASVGTNSNVLATYNVTADYVDGKMDSYKVEKV